jgi:hypothetical protein
VFKTLFNNKYFWIIFLVELFIQHGFLYLGATKLGGPIVGTVNLEMSDQITCWVIALMGLAVNVAAKKIPIEHFNFTKSIDLEATEASDPITAMMNDGEKYFQETPQDDDYTFKDENK